MVENILDQNKYLCFVLKITQKILGFFKYNFFVKYYGKNYVNSNRSNKSRFEYSCVISNYSMLHKYPVHTK